MALAAGTRVGPYEIVAPVGAGGMGEVYRARDAKLGRDVAIKVLPEAFLLHPDRVSRFEREARVLASLSHPHIGAIYGVESVGDLHALILELIEGPTLAERLKSAPIALVEALGMARQIADGLDAAQEKGIVHRDLKPANIKIDPRGFVKVLDFGLAMVEAGDVAAADLSQSPTMAVGGTRAGAILGTAAYMSPEQARGKPLDKRADIWSFGCVLFEILARRPAFSGETITDITAAILGHEPEWSALPADTPLAVRRLLQRCLEKDPAQRLRDIGDARHELDHAIADLRQSRDSTVRGAAPPGRSQWSRLLATATAAVVFAIVGIGGLFIVRGTKPAAPAPLEPPAQLTDFNDAALAPALSADGRMLAFIRGGNFAGSAVAGQIYVKMLPKGEPVQLTRDPASKEQPVFSPDGSRIIYTSAQSFKWDSWQVPVLGGAPQPFLPNASGLMWIDDQHLLYSEVMTGIHMGIVTSTESRVGSRAVYFPRSDAGMAHRSMRSPDGKSVLVVEMNGADWLPCRLLPFDGSSEGRAVGPVDAQCTTAAWSPDGHWMYFSSNAGGMYHIWRQRYPDGRPEQVTSEPTEQEGTAITPDGKYLITSMGLQQASITLKGPAGERRLTSEGFAMLPTMMPSGDRVFYLMRSGSRGFVSGELWSMNPETGEKTRALPGRLMANYSISADGRRAVFTSLGVEGGDGIWIAGLDRRTAPRQLTRGQEFRAFFGAPGEIVFMTQTTVRQLYRMKEDGAGVEMISPDPVVNLITVSPDGHWAVALVPETGGGTRTEFRSLRGEPSIRVCCSIGFANRMQAPIYQWSADGKSLFVALQFFGRNTAKTVVLPYRSGIPLDVQWPKGLNAEEDVAANPGARVINEANVFPASTPASYLIWSRSTQSNLYRVALPN